MRQDFREVIEGAQVVAQLVVHYVMNFRVLAALFFMGYAISCLLTGTTRDRSWKVYTRKDNPDYFWAVVAMTFSFGLIILISPDF